MRVKIVKGEHKWKTGEIVGTLWGAGLTIIKLDDTNDEVALTPYDFIPIRDKEEKIKKSTSNKEIIMQDIIVTKEMLEQLRTQFDDKNYAKILDIIKPVKVSQLDLSLE